MARERPALAVAVHSLAVVAVQGPPVVQALLELLLSEMALAAVAGAAGKTHRTHQPLVRPVEHVRRQRASGLALERQAQPGSREGTAAMRPGHTAAAVAGAAVELQVPTAATVAMAGRGEPAAVAAVVPRTQILLALVVLAALDSSKFTGTRSMVCSRKT